MSQEWKLVPVEPTDEMLDVEVTPVLCIGRPNNPRVGQWRLGMYRAMLAAAPVPSAGGKVEVLAWRVLGYNFNTEAFALDYAKWAENVEPVQYLVDRAHVTRLQAGALEDQRLRTELMEQFNTLQSERDALKVEVERLTVLLHDRSVHI